MSEPISELRVHLTRMTSNSFRRAQTLLGLDDTEVFRLALSLLTIYAETIESGGTLQSVTAQGVKVLELKERTDVNTNNV